MESLKDAKERSGRFYYFGNFEAKLAPCQYVEVLDAYDLPAEDMFTDTLNYLEEKGFLVGGGGNG